jgi:hypothetical protein
VAVPPRDAAEDPALDPARPRTPPNRALHVEPGDIVVFHRPAGRLVPDKVLIKRVIGVGGDVIGPAFLIIWPPDRIHSL